MRIEPLRGLLTKACRISGCLATGILLFATALMAQVWNRPSSEIPREDALLQFAPSRRADGPAKYVAHAKNYTVYLTDEEADVVLHDEAQPRGPLARGKVIIVQAYANALRMRFVDTNPPTSVAPVELAKNRRVSFHAAGTRFSSGIVFRGIYPGTDVVLRGSEREMKFELRLSPGADASGIVLEVDGATKIALDAKGNAEVRAGEASLLLARPSFFLTRGGVRQRLAGHFQIEPRNRLRFVADAAIQSEPAVID